MFDNFEFNPDLVPKLKLGVHAVQIVLGLVIWCLEISVFTGSTARITGNNGWVFGVVCLRPQPDPARPSRRPRNWLTSARSVF